MIWVIRELFYLNIGFIRVFGGWAVESLLGIRRQPDLKDFLDPGTLSSYVGIPITSVSENNEKVLGAGAGGTGTCRFALTATTLNEKLHLFVKIPTTSLLECAFLALFNVYDNEIRFYANYLPSMSKSLDTDKWTLAPRVFASRRIGCGKFVLIIEDTRYREEGCIFKSTQTVPFDVKGAESALFQLSRMHALYWRNYPSGVWGYSPDTGLPNLNTPPFLRILAVGGLWQVKRRYGKELKLHSAVIEAFYLAVNNFQKLRKYWSRGPLTLVHGDAHMGNIFTSSDSLQVGMIDFQCVCQDNFMRDVSYHLINSCPVNELQEREVGLIRHYLSQLESAMKNIGNEKFVDEIPSVEEAIHLYRSHAIWSLIAWVICCGFSDVVIGDFAVSSLQRALDTCLRLNVLEEVKTNLK